MKKLLISLLLVSLGLASWNAVLDANAPITPGDTRQTSMDGTPIPTGQ